MAFHAAAATAGDRVFDRHTMIPFTPLFAPVMPEVSVQDGLCPAALVRPGVPSSLDTTQELHDDPKAVLCVSARIAIRKSNGNTRASWVVNIP